MITAVWGFCKWLFKAVWVCFKWPLKMVWRVFKLPFLLTLPLTALPILLGVIDGVLFSLWHNSQIALHGDIWLNEIKHLVNDWGPRKMTFRKYQDTHNDFNITRLNSNDWTQKLGFIHPREYYDDERTPINKFGSLDTLMVNTSPQCGPGPPREQWVIVTDWAFPMVDRWDKAFENAIAHARLTSELHATNIFFAQCQSTAGFLCGVWNVKTPALLHFSVGDHPPLPEDIHSGFTYTVAHLLDLRPVAVRVIEFPLKDAFTGLPWTEFPGRNAQVLAIMQGDRLYEQFPTWNEIDQLLRRFEDYRTEVYKRKGTFLYYIGNADDWIADQILKPIHLDEAAQVTYMLCFFPTYSLLNIFFMLPLRHAQLAILDALGHPRKGDRMFHGFQKEWNVWDDLQGSLEWIKRVSEKAARQAEIYKEYPDGKITTKPNLRAAASATSSFTSSTST
jgi:hypothetical protein